MLKEASSAAAERAKQNVMKAYENATKLSLNVKITVKDFCKKKKRIFICC